MILLPLIILGGTKYPCSSYFLFNLVRTASVDISYKPPLPVMRFIPAGGIREEVPDRSVFKVVLIVGVL